MSRIWTTTTASKFSFADVAIVADTEGRRDALLSEWEKEAAAEEVVQLDLMPGECAFGHDEFTLIEKDALDEHCGLRGDAVDLTWNDLIADGEGVTLIRVGLNG